MPSYEDHLASTPHRVISNYSSLQTVAVSMMSRWDKSHKEEAFTLVDHVFTLISLTGDAHVTGGEKNYLILI